MRSRPWIVALSLACAACAANRPAPSQGYPGVLRAPSAYAADFLIRWHVHATYGARVVSFDAVVQKRGNELTLLGLTPYGSRAFVARQVGETVTFERFVPLELPFPASYMLLDVHRALLAGLGQVGEILTDGLHEEVRGEEHVRERWSAGRLVERGYRRASGEPSGEIVIGYDGGMIPGRDLPKHLVLHNAWFGYRLDITIASFERLEAKEVLER